MSGPSPPPPHATGSCRRLVPCPKCYVILLDVALRREVTDQGRDRRVGGDGEERVRDRGRQGRNRDMDRERQRYGERQRQTET